MFLKQVPAVPQESGTVVVLLVIIHVYNVNYYVFVFLVFSNFFLLLVKSNHFCLSTAIAPNGQQLSSSDQSSKESVLPPLDVPSLEDKIKELQSNISVIKTFMVWFGHFSNLHISLPNIKIIFFCCNLLDCTLYKYLNFKLLFHFFHAVQVEAVYLMGRSF